MAGYPEIEQCGAASPGLDCAMLRTKMAAALAISLLLVSFASEIHVSGSPVPCGEFELFKEREKPHHSRKMKMEKKIAEGIMEFFMMLG